VVAVVIAPFFAAIIIATWSGGRHGQSSAEPLGTWSTWSMVGSTWLACGLAWPAQWLDAARFCIVVAHWMA